MSGCLTGNTNDEQLAQGSEESEPNSVSMLQDSIDRLNDQTHALVVIAAITLVVVIVVLVILGSFL